MRRLLVSAIVALCVVSNNALAKQTVRFEKLDKPRVIVLTDAIGSSIGKRGNYNGAIEISSSDAKEASFTAPAVSKAARIHAILELKDDGKPNLYSCRRVIVTVRP